jgi:hypothetical protein
MMAALGSSGTELHPGILEIIHRTIVTMLAATPPAIAFVAVMEVPLSDDRRPAPAMILLGD